MKEVYNVRLLAKQFESMSKVMKAVVQMPTLGDGEIEGPIRVSLTHGEQTMTLEMSKAAES